ncbi:tetratricopeptide repeat protein [Pilimelia anulata]|uniref:tetratricopeptide repeat protein n=1 Tax=Pilimelia anulata TaxID=53371 RepID=UPI0016644777|nr:tetratricopeptide repeat protein [Pilimelia anulata]
MLSVRAMALIDLRRYRRAAALGARILAGWAADVDALCAGAGALAESRNGPRALSAAWDAVRLAPEQARTHLVLGLVAAGLGQYELAARAYAEALEREPDLAAIANDPGVGRLEIRRQHRALERLLGLGPGGAPPLTGPEPTTPTPPGGPGRPGTARPGPGDGSGRSGTGQDGAGRRPPDRFDAGGAAERFDAAAAAGRRDAAAAAGRAEAAAGADRSTADGPGAGGRDSAGVAGADGAVRAPDPADRAPEPPAGAGPSGAGPWGGAGAVRRDGQRVREAAVATHGSALAAVLVVGAGLPLLGGAVALLAGLLAVVLGGAAVGLWARARFARTGRTLGALAAGLLGAAALAALAATGLWWPLIPAALAATAGLVRTRR